MNIKHILSLLLCIAGTYTETAQKSFIFTSDDGYLNCPNANVQVEATVQKKLDIAANAYRNRLKSWENLYGYGSKTFDEESEAFKQTLEEFLKPHHKNLQEEKEKCQKYFDKWKDTYWLILPNIQKKYHGMFFKFNGHNAIIEAFNDENGDTFLKSNKSTDKFAEDALNNMITKLTVKAGRKDLFDYGHSITYKIMEMIKQQP